MISIKTFEFNPFSENTYVISDESAECIIVDPGCLGDDEKRQLSQFIDDNELVVKKLVNTHCHIDHVFGNAFVKSTYGVGLTIHKLDEPTLESVIVYAPMYGFRSYEPSHPDEFIEEGDSLSFGNSTFEIIFVPGHAPGHIALVNREQKICIAGDVLFRESIGRTDLPGGDHETLIKSIHEKMFELDDETVVYPGHGPTTTIGYEKSHNPFCAIISNG